MYSGHWQGLTFVFVACATFCLATATNCTSPSKSHTHSTDLASFLVEIVHVQLCVAIYYFSVAAEQKYDRGAGARGREAPDYPREASVCEGQELVKVCVRRSRIVGGPKAPQAPPVLPPLLLLLVEAQTILLLVCISTVAFNVVKTVHASVYQNLHYCLEYSY